MEISRINEILSNMDNIENAKNVSLISSNQPSNYYEEKYQGDESQKVEIFDIGEDNIFLKIVSTTDSYGSNERVTSIQFVKPVKKEVIVYE